MPLNQTQCDNAVYYGFLANGWMPTGTTVDNWEAVTFGAMHFDDPALPSDPDFQKKRASLDIQHAFFLLNGAIKDPIDQLKQSETTLRQFSDWCFTNQV